MIEQNIQTKGRLLAKIVWQMLKVESFDSLADLTDALKYRCVTLKIAITPDDVSDAYALIATNHPLVCDPFWGLERVDTHVEALPDPPVFSRDAATQVLQQIKQRLGVAVPIRRVPPVKRLKHRDVDRQRALAIIAQGIRAVQDERRDR